MINVHKILLYLTRRRLQVYENQSGLIQVVASFEDGPSQRAECARFLMQQAPSLVQLLVDVSDEDFQMASIPRLGRRDRARLLQRRLEQMYRTTSYCAAARQGWKDAGRHEEDILFSALPDGGWVDQWLDLLEEYGHVLSGIVSPALLSQHQLLRLLPRQAHQLLLSWGGTGELRQTYAVAGGVRFSRLVPLEPHGGLDVPSRLLAESLRAQQYLLSMRLLARSEDLHVLIVAPALYRQAVSQICVDQETLYFSFIDPAGALQKLGLGGRGDCDVQGMFARLALDVGVSHYAPAHRLLGFHRWQIARALQVSGLALGTVALCAGLWISSRLVPLKEQQVQVAGRMSALQQQLQQAHAWAQQHDVARLRAAGHIYHQYIQPWPRPGDGMRWLANVLDVHPHIRLQRIGWMFSMHATADPLSAVPENEPRAQIAAATGFEGRDVPHAGYLILGLIGSIEVAGGGYRAALQELEKFRHDVIRAGDRHLMWQTLPLDPRSNAQLSLDSTPKPPQFSARIVMPILSHITDGAHG